MENKNEKSMTLEEMISEILKDAKVVKVPLPAKTEEKTEVQKQDKPMPAHLNRLFVCLQWIFVSDLTWKLGRKIRKMSEIKE
ncbi:hypothetical protein [Blautia wexlerae]|uniref:hypothetical protein n=1 Tax=Blautia wexlerae TaxID=418240 RepID=UPI0015708373|nr:hypothetical protein [Blautia wexlerae]NSF39998.1 hypothetical protein [Blautia wexlerae]